MASTLTFITEGIPAFIVGVYKSFSIEASGGEPPYTFEITEGSLPAGLTMDEDGTISGTPEAEEMTTPFFKLSDANGDSITQAMEVNVGPDETGSTSESSNK